MILTAPRACRTCILLTYLLKMFVAAKQKLNSQLNETTVCTRVGHGLGPPMGWVGLGWVRVFKFLVGWVGLGGDLTA